MSLVDWTLPDLESYLESSGGRVVLKFWAPWCGPCKMVAPVVERVASLFPDILFAQVNIDEQPVISKRFLVRSIPMLVGIENGQVSWVHVGMISAVQLEERVKKWA